MPMDIIDDPHHHPTPNKRPIHPHDQPRAAIAIQDSSRQGKGTSAKIIASGRGKIAEDIVAIAFDQGIKVREDADLVQLLITLDLDTPIPSEAIFAVAEILQKVYAFNKALGSP